MGYRTKLTPCCRVYTALKLVRGADNTLIHSRPLGIGLWSRTAGQSTLQTSIRVVLLHVPHEKLMMNTAA